MQTLITTAIVLASASYATWALMPSGWRRALARRLGRPLPAPVGCGGCGGCGDAARPGPTLPTNPPAAQPITVHRRGPGPG